MDDFPPRPTILSRSLSSGKVRPDEKDGFPRRRPMRLSHSAPDLGKTFLGKEGNLEKKITFLEEFKSAAGYDLDDYYDDLYDHGNYFDDCDYEDLYGMGTGDYNDAYDDLFDTVSDRSAPADNVERSADLLHAPSNLETMLQDQSARPHHIPLQDLKEITDNFSDERILGQGGFGVVYKGVLPNGETIAVKKIVSSLMPGLQKQYENDVYRLLLLNHPNIVRCVGYCYETRNECLEYNGEYVFAEVAERLLCLEYLPMGSLDKYLSGFHA